VRHRSSWPLAEASETLAGIASLTGAEAERIGVRIDRLTSRLARISPSGRADINRAD